MLIERLNDYITLNDETALTLKNLYNTQGRS